MPTSASFYMGESVVQPEGGVASGSMFIRRGDAPADSEEGVGSASLFCGRRTHLSSSQDSHREGLVGAIF